MIDIVPYSIAVCQCECGNVSNVEIANLLNGASKSCGCLQRDKTKERRAQSIRYDMNGNEIRLYRVWSAMLRRCYNSSAQNYKYYGQRGITVCDEWKTNYESFYQWAITHGYNDNLFIDRIDNNGSYCPQNCKWSTRKEQSNNRRSNLHITAYGVTLLTSEWSQLIGVPLDLIGDRAWKSMPIERILYPGNLVHASRDDVARAFQDLRSKLIMAGYLKDCEHSNEN